jgi:hypothetical protein
MKYKVNNILIVCFIGFMKSVMDDTGNVSPSGIPGLSSVSFYRILVFRACKEAGVSRENHQPAASH